MLHRHDDNDRSSRIINDAVNYGQSEGADVGFASLVVNSLLEQGRREEEGTYPPPGHSYPRRDT
ncbi:hypothetical protein AB0B21_20505 [Streptomyces rimosus]|uniref:hypothetical protein n=1 Tax=Streptomyces rimosus TaxID=1927 RepID=UPI00131CEB0F|nr:hypothetical protein [Streptomyces rimosus]